MKRKRYKKLLMGLGVTRNRATKCAEVARNQDGDYTTGLLRYLQICREIYPEMAYLFEIESSPRIIRAYARTNAPLYPRCARTVKIDDMREEVAGHDLPEMQK